MPEFFKAIQELLKKDGTMGIQFWFDSQQFVYADTDDGLISYKDYRLAKMA